MELADLRSSMQKLKEAALLQQDLERNYFASGQVHTLMSRAESKVMRGVKWRPVAITLVFDKCGNVIYRDWVPTYKLTYHQVGRCGYFYRWIRYEIRAGDLLLDVSWRTDAATLCRTIKDVKGWIKSMNQK